MKTFTFSTTHDENDGPFPIDAVMKDIPNVKVAKYSASNGTPGLYIYTFTVTCAEGDDTHEIAFLIGRCLQEKRHALLMKEYIDKHLNDTSN